MPEPPTTHDTDNMQDFFVPSSLTLPSPPRAEASQKSVVDSVAQQLDFNSSDEEEHSSHHEDVNRTPRISCHSNESSSSSHYKRQRQRHKRRRDSTPRNKRHKRRRRTSSSSSSSSSSRHDTRHRSKKTRASTDTNKRKHKPKHGAPPLTNEETWLTLCNKTTRKTSAPTAKYLRDCVATVLHKGGFHTIPHIKHPSQICIEAGPHRHKDRPTQWIIRLPLASKHPKLKSCGSITLYATRWSMAMTEGNVMINANPPITRNVRTALLTHCADSFTIPTGQHPTYPQATSKRHNCDLPQNMAHKH